MKRILIVDSDLEVCRAIQKALMVTPHAAFFAFDAVNAISEASKCQPNLIIVSFSLPAGDRLVVVERLRSLSGLKWTPIIMIAERGARLEAERALDAGANAFLPKPLNRYLLLQYVDRLLPAEATQNTWLDSAQSTAH
jgi:DNA-binding response OmpR family regulator